MSQPVGGGWWDNCYVQSMTHTTLAPEGDDPHPVDLKSRRGAKAPTEAQTLLFRFDPKKVGFGILAPWPGGDQGLRIKESSTIMSFVECKKREDEEL
jgi:hypothetical protein